MKFDVAKFISLLQLAPYIVEGVFQIHSESSTETKTQLATDALALATGVAGAVDPVDTAIIAAASAGVQGIVQALSHAKAALTKAPAPLAPGTLTPVPTA